MSLCNNFSQDCYENGMLKALSEESTAKCPNSQIKYLRCRNCSFWHCFLTFVSEWEMPPVSRTWDPEAEGAGWGAQPRDKGVERKASTQEEGAFINS